MTHDHRRGSMRGRMRALTVVGAITALAALGVAAPALATPKGAYAPFADCPTSDPGILFCTYGLTTSGEFTIGKTTVPITKTITLQGGAELVAEGTLALLPAKDGNSLSKTEQNVPGGLLDLVNCTEIKGEGFFEKLERETCKAIFENKTTGVTATTELVANEHNPALLYLTKLLSASGTALTLPVRVHLNNTLLGSSCYIGSEAHPIELNLTTGTTSPPPPNKPISGKVGTVTPEEEDNIISVTENSLVDNSFSAPVAEGCGFLGLLDGIIDSKIGLPAEAGHNTAKLNGSLKTALASAVVESEG